MRELQALKSRLDMECGILAIQASPVRLESGCHNLAATITRAKRALEEYQKRDCEERPTGMFLSGTPILVRALEV